MPAHSASSGQRSPDPAAEQTVDLARRRLAALTAELAADRGEPVPAPEPPPGPGPVSAEPADVEPASSSPAAGAPSGVAGVPATAGQRARPALASAVGWLADRLPTGLQGRVHLGSAQVGVVCLVVAVGLVLGAVWLVRADGAPGEVVPPRAGAEAPTAATGAGPGVGPGTSTGAPASDPATEPVPRSSAGPSTPPAGADGNVAKAEIVVDVVGKVRHPGIAVLPAGSRVADAVDAAGGLADGVDRKLVNLARVLVDGEQIIVGDKPDPAVAGTTAGPGPVPATGANAGTPGTGGGPGGGTVLVNINTADQPTLETLPGVGPVTAGAILEWRIRNGAFTAVEELLEVDGIGEATLAKLVPHVTL